MSSLNKFLLMVLINSLFIVVGSSYAQTAPTMNAIDVFNLFKKLDGKYVKKGAEEDGVISYRLSARNNVVVETWNMKNNREEVTVFFMDGEDLLATHYCAAGIYPTMKLVQGQEKGSFVFQLHEIKNLDSPSTPHNSGFTYTLSESGEIIRDEFWTKNKETSHSQQVLIRIPDNS